MSPVPAIEAAGLGRDYGATRALAALDLVVPAGALVGLLGPNGAGKTTAMLLLATLLAPTRGTARVFGHDVSRARRAARERLGLVFQEPTVDPFLTVRENLEFAGRLAGVPPRGLARCVGEALER
ncbi:MAG TPA: ATP-binding cassette domain-containing protein, partial [Gemmatimonadales bacterium]|nr:ATP-binding cassette domain-containing protein [Gemmatimonadales bacterium]